MGFSSLRLFAKHAHVILYAVNQNFQIKSAHKYFFLMLLRINVSPKFSCAIHHVMLLISSFSNAYDLNNATQTSLELIL